MTKTNSDNMTIKQKALAHFKSKMAGDLLKLKVDEWDCDIFYRATSSMATEAKIVKLTTDGRTAEALVESIIQKAMDIDGKRLFQETDRPALMNEVDPKVLIKVAGALNNANSETIGDIEKN